MSGACVYVHRDVVVCRRAFPGEGPAAQGPRARRNWPSPRASSSAPRTMLLPSPSPPPCGGRATPEMGQMLRRAVCQTASNVYQPRPASPDRGHGVRRDDWGTPFGVRSPPWIRPRNGLLSGCSLPPAADRSRRLSAPRAVSRPLAGHPPRTCFARPRPLRFSKGANTGGCLAGSLCDAGLTRRAPGTGPPTLRHGPPGLAPDIRSDEGRRRRRQRRWGLVGAALDRVLLVDRCLRLLTFDPCGRLGRGSAHVCAALCFVLTTYILARMYQESSAFV